MLGIPMLHRKLESTPDQVTACPTLSLVSLEESDKETLQSVCYCSLSYRCYHCFSVLCLPVEDSTSSLAGKRRFYELLVVSGYPNRSFSQFYRSFFHSTPSPATRGMFTSAALLAEGARKC